MWEGVGFSPHPLPHWWNGARNRGSWQKLLKKALAQNGGCCANGNPEFLSNRTEMKGPFTRGPLYICIVVLYKGDTVFRDVRTEAEETTDDSNLTRLV